jgi:hypothetical protein
MSDTVKTALKVTVTVALIALLITRVDLRQTREQFATLNGMWFAAGFAIFMARNALAAWRWQLLLTPQGHHIRLIDLIRFYLIGNFIGFFMPSVVGGDVARGYYTYKAGVSPRISASTVLVERIIGVAAMMLFALVAIAFGINIIEDGSVGLIIVGVALVTLALIVAFFTLDLTSEGPSLPGPLKKWGQKGARLIETMREHRNRRDILAASFGLSMLYQLGGIVTAYMIGLSVGATTPFVYYLMILPIIWVITLLPISINGLGLREGSFVFFFGAVGMPEEMAITISVLYLFTLILQALSGGFFFLFDRHDVQAVKQFTR